MVIILLSHSTMIVKKVHGDAQGAVDYDPAAAAPAKENYCQYFLQLGWQCCQHVGGMSAQQPNVGTFKKKFPLRQVTGNLCHRPRNQSLD